VSRPEPTVCSDAVTPRYRTRRIDYTDLEPCTDPCVGLEASSKTWRTGRRGNHATCDFNCRSAEVITTPGTVQSR
jgi:hypothetical protein